jgi:hypothetical protein
MGMRVEISARDFVVEVMVLVSLCFWGAARCVSKLEMREGLVLVSDSLFSGELEGGWGIDMVQRTNLAGKYN